MALTLASGCKHDVLSDMQLAKPLPTVEQRLALDWRYGSHSYDISSLYQDDQGHTFRLDTLRFLISGARAVDDGGEVLADYSEKFLLADASGPSDFLLGALTSDHLHEIQFSIGLDAETNHTDPASAQTPLNDLSMHSGSTEAGYCFLHMSGLVDSNNDGTIDDNDQRFSYRCIGDALLEPAAALVHGSLPETGTLTAWLPVDLEILLADIDLLNTPSYSGSGAVSMAWMQRLIDAMAQEH